MEPGVSCGSCASRASCAQLNNATPRLRGFPLVATAAFTFIVPPLLAITAATALPLPAPLSAVLGLVGGALFGQLVNRRIQARCSDAIEEGR